MWTTPLDPAARGTSFAGTAIDVLLEPRLRVVIGGGGLAALEAALALRELAGDRVTLTLVSPRRDVVLSPLAVRTAFGAGRVPRWPLTEITRELRARHVRGAIGGVDAAVGVAASRRHAPSAGWTPRR